MSSKWCYRPEFQAGEITYEDGSWVILKGQGAENFERAYSLAGKVQQEKLLDDMKSQAHPKAGR